MVGVPQSGLNGGSTPARSGWWGVPQPGLDGGGVPGVPPGQVWMVGGTQVRSGFWGGTSARSGSWGVPQPGLDGEGVPGVPPWLGLDGGGGAWGTPPTPIRQSSIASTCYPSGGMPLTLTQEDFLVCNNFLSSPNVSS